MNLSKYIGKTRRHVTGARFVVSRLFIDDDGEVICVDTHGLKSPLANSKSIRIVKRKKSQVLVDALEEIVAHGHSYKHLHQNYSDVGKETVSFAKLVEFRMAFQVAEAALEKYREKDVKK